MPNNLRYWQSIMREATTIESLTNAWQAFVTEFNKLGEGDEPIDAYWQLFFKDTYAMYQRMTQALTQDPVDIIVPPVYPPPTWPDVIPDVPGPDVPPPKPGEEDGIVEPPPEKIGDMGGTVEPDIPAIASEMESRAREIFRRLGVQQGVATESMDLFVSQGVASLQQMIAFYSSLVGPILPYGFEGDDIEIERLVNKRIEDMLIWMPASVGPYSFPSIYANITVTPTDKTGVGTFAGMLPGLSPRLREQFMRKAATYLPGLRQTWEQTLEPLRPGEGMAYVTPEQRQERERGFEQWLQQFDLAELFPEYSVTSGGREISRTGGVPTKFTRKLWASPFANLPTTTMR